MIHMLCRFDLAPGVTLDALRAAYARFVSEMREAGLVEGSQEIGTRVGDTPMDTDDMTRQSHFVVMSFRDRTQMDRSYARVAARRISAGAEADHRDFRSAITNEVFTCWEDGAPPAPVRER